MQQLDDRIIRTDLHAEQSNCREYCKQAEPRKYDVQNAENRHLCWSILNRRFACLTLKRQIEPTANRNQPCAFSTI